MRKTCAHKRKRVQKFFFSSRSALVRRGLLARRRAQDDDFHRASFDFFSTPCICLIHGYREGNLESLADEKLLGLLSTRLLWVQERIACSRDQQGNDRPGRRRSRAAARRIAVRVVEVSMLDVAAPAVTIQ